MSIIIAIIVLYIIGGIFIMSLCKVAAEADERMEQMMRDERRRDD